MASAVSTMDAMIFISCQPIQTQRDNIAAAKGTISAGCDHQKFSDITESLYTILPLTCIIPTGEDGFFMRSSSD